MKILLKILVFLPITVFLQADSSNYDHTSMGSMHDHSSMEMTHADKHTMSHHSLPIGIMGNMHHKGFMLSLKQGWMKMKGNIFDGNSISNSQILLMPNPFGNMPPNLSIIPKTMDMKMTMIDGMYALSEDLTLMLMATYVSKDMNLETYSPMMPRSSIGQFSSSSSDLSSLSFSGLFRIIQTNNSKWFGEISLKESIGQNDSMATVLTPMGKKMTMTMPYAMQSGDNSSSLILGLTNLKEINEKVVFGNQLKRKIVVSESDWSFGDQTELSTWAQYFFNKSTSFSARLKFIDEDSISGKNPLIMGPVQTANPMNYGGYKIYLGFGLNINLNILQAEKDTIGFEILKPIKQDLNGLQMEKDYQIIVGYKKNI